MDSEPSKGGNGTRTETGTPVYLHKVHLIDTRNLFKMSSISEPGRKAEEAPSTSKPWRANMRPISGQPAAELTDKDKENEEEAKAVDEEEQRPWRKNMKKVEDHVTGKSHLGFRCFQISSLNINITSD